MAQVHRVVVTGLGLVTPLGVGTTHVWNRLLAGKSGITSIFNPHAQTRSDLAGCEALPVTIAGLVPQGSCEQGGFNPDEWQRPGDARVMALFTQYAVAAARQAVDDAQWHAGDERQQERAGVCVGSSMGSLQDICDQSSILNTRGHRRVSPQFVPRLLANMAAGHIAMLFGLQGPNHSASTACTTGAHSIGDAMRFIRHGDADVMLAGGSEACIHPLSVAGFHRAKALSTRYNDHPTLASRPFDRDRDGFVIGEGAGVLVLESLSHAMERGARIYAEIAGYGLSGDAYHMTAPPQNGRGAKLCMTRAMVDAGVADPQQVDYVNAHATSTPLGDHVEGVAIHDLFGSGTAVSSTKGATGHLLGAAGAVEAIFAVLSLHHRVIPPTLNLDAPDAELESAVDFVRGSPREKQIRTVLTNSFGFGGTNASLCFKAFDGEQP